jgi:DNA polymerase V
MQNFDETDINNTPGVSVHTGFPNPATDAARRNGLNLSQLLIQNSASTFMMRIAGGNWQYLGIFNDDIILIDRSLGPRHNDLVVWWNDGDFAISEFARMQPGATVWGVVTATIHEFRKTAHHENQ